MTVVNPSVARRAVLRWLLRAPYLALFEESCDGVLTDSVSYNPFLGDHCHEVRNSLRSRSQRMLKRILPSFTEECEFFSHFLLCCAKCLW